MISTVKGHHQTNLNNSNFRNSNNAELFNSNKTSINKKTDSTRRENQLKVPPIRAKQLNNASSRLGHQDRHQTILKPLRTTNDTNIQQQLKTTQRQPNNRTKRRPTGPETRRHHSQNPNHKTHQYQNKQAATQITNRQPNLPKETKNQPSGKFTF